MKTYKVYCEYLLKAKDKESAEEFVINELATGDFMESHLIVEENYDEYDEEDIYEVVGTDEENRANKH